MRTLLDKVESQDIQNKLAPIVAEHGVGAVIIALADRLRIDSQSVEGRGPMGARIAVDLVNLGGALREAVEKYGLGYS